MEYAVTFLEGIITFISPCLLPMLPIYVAFFAGGSNAAGGTGQTLGPNRRMKQSLASSAGFVFGFTVLFALMGAFAGSLGGFFSHHQSAVNLVCGIVVVAFGLNYAGVVRIPVLERTLKPKSTVKPRGFFSSVLFGTVFAIGWTPCVGAFLGSALSLAAAVGSTAKGVALLVCYSLGLGVPFLLAAVLLEQLTDAFAWIKRHYATINTVCGLLLVAVGILMATGQLGLWLSALSIR